LKISDLWLTNENRPGILVVKWRIDMPRHRTFDDWITGNDGYDRDANETDPYREEEEQYQFYCDQTRRAQERIDWCIENNVTPGAWELSWCPFYRKKEWPG
jgi:hypothetical protein